MVLDQGSIVEFAPPNVLSSGLFVCSSDGLRLLLSAEELEKILSLPISLVRLFKASLTLASAVRYFSVAVALQGT